MIDLRPWRSLFRIQQQTPEKRRNCTRSATNEPQTLHWKKLRADRPPEAPHELADGAGGDADTIAAEEKPEDKSPPRHRRLHHTDADHGHQLATESPAPIADAGDADKTMTGAENKSN